MLRRLSWSRSVRLHRTLLASASTHSSDGESDCPRLIARRWFTRPRRLPHPPTAQGHDRVLWPVGMRSGAESAHDSVGARLSASLRSQTTCSVRKHSGHMTARLMGSPSAHRRLESCKT